MKKALVTGGTGHVGLNLLKRLNQEKRPVRVLLAPGTSLPEDIDAEVVLGDIRDYDAMRKACEGVETVFHLAGIISITGAQGGRVWDVNVNGTEATARAALDSGVKRFVHVSSIHAFDINTYPDREVTEAASRPTKAHPFYDQSKSAGEDRVRDLISRGLDAVIVNPTGIIGPYDMAPSRMGRLFLDLFKDGLSFLVDNGFNWVDVRDVVDGILGAEAKGKTGENYILSGHWHSMVELARLAEEARGLAISRIVLPTWTVYLAIPILALLSKFTKKEPLVTKDSLHAVRGSHRISYQKAAAELDYQPRATKETVKAIYESFVKLGQIPKAKQISKKVAPPSSSIHLV